MIEINKILATPRFIYVTRKVHFNASHRLFNPNFTNDENNKIFGECNNYYGHGHNYEIKVTLCGTIDSKTGYLFDLKALKKILEDEILSKVDHRHLNFDVHMFKDTIPTAEIIAVTFWDILKPRIAELNANVRLYQIKIYETERNSVTYRGE